MQITFGFKIEIHIKENIDRIAGASLNAVRFAFAFEWAHASRFGVSSRHHAESAFNSGALGVLGLRAKPGAVYSRYS